MSHSHARKQAEHFLSTGDAFHLGDLPTEQRHPETKELADLSRNDPQRALDILQKIDLGVVERVAAKLPEIENLAAAIEETFASGGRVFFYGCGATGRLSLSVEYIWRFLHQKKKKADQVVGFMSGGDLALVHSIENFEDHPEFGARQVRDLKFGKNDLLVSCTEGGETPSVIGATEEAAKRSKRKPWFLYCNPDEILREKVERSRRVLDNPRIEKICLFVGPMSLSGSTRLQATTALQLAAGLALVRAADGPKADIQFFLQFLKKSNYSLLTPFVELESAAYLRGEFFLYETNYYAITILTDTTERSPTFSLPGFENQKEKTTKPALSYVAVPQAKNSKDAWQKLLLRKPIPIEWSVLRGVAGAKRLYGFDFSQKLPALRKKKLKSAKQHTFKIHRKGAYLDFFCGKARAQINVSELHPLFEHLYLKLLLNAHSTLVMGRLGRFESNVMTWVKPSNNKLIDRSIRYVEFLLKKDHADNFTYKEIALQLFEEIEKLQPGESVVLKTVAVLEAKRVGIGSAGLEGKRKILLARPSPNL